jgi:hypothetical protein
MWEKLRDALLAWDRKVGDQTPSGAVERMAGRRPLSTPILFRSRRRRHCARNPFVFERSSQPLPAYENEQGGNQRARARLGYRGPHGKPHLMAASGAPVDANGCVASLRKPLDTCDFHHFAAATRRPFSGTWHQQTLKHRHRKPAARTATTQSPRPSKHAIAVARGQMRVRTEINLKRVVPRTMCHVSRTDFGKGARLKSAQRALCAPCRR